ncbi:hypothetical protein ACWGH2_26795 [Streptomyces sp. NPDC054871]
MFSGLDGTGDGAIRRAGRSELRRAARRGRLSAVSRARCVLRPCLRLPDTRAPQ